LLLPLLSFAKNAHAQDLAPPSTGAQADPSSTPPPPAEDAKLGTEEKKDSKRGLEWVYLNADAGFSYISMDSLSNSNLGVTNSSSAGPTFGVAAGIRLFILTLGARANLNALSSFNLWQMDAELGIHIPIGHWEPYFGLHGGYCFVGSLDDGISGSPNVSVTGGDAGAQLGLDYYFNHFVSLGIDVSGNALFLNRPPTALPAGVSSQLTASQQAIYKQSGDSVGLGVAPSLRLGFHL
jgi:hypothetical protein